MDDGHFSQETFAHAPELISGDLPREMTDPTTAKPTFVPWTWSGITSLCHPWSAGPGFWISQNLLGVKPIKPGFQTFVIRPQLTASLQRVNGVVPSVLGPFEVSFDLAEAQANLSIPSGVHHGRLEITLLPSHTLQAESVRIDGMLLRSSMPGDLDAAWSASSMHRVVVENLRTGDHRVSWTLLSDARGRPPVGPLELAPSAYPAPQFAARFVGRDDTTQVSAECRVLTPF